MSIAIKESPFKDVNYTKDRDLQKHYQEQMSFLLAKLYKIKQEEIKPLVSKIFKRQSNGFKDKFFKVAQKNKYGDREVKVMSAGDFFETVEEKNYHLSPSLVAYTNSDEEQCVNSIGTVKFLGDRKFFKGKRQEAKAVGNKEEERAFDQIQNALKIFNNAQSGAMSSNGTPINNKSGHTTLTSTCRVLTSLANICNERLLSGNRLFISYERTIENFLSQITNTDLKRLKKFMDTNSMVYPTTEQVMNMVRRCTYYYWSDSKRLKMIEEFVDLLTPIEKASIFLISDIKAIMETNPKFIDKFFKDWIRVPDFPEDGVLPEDKDIKPTNGDYYNLAISKLRINPNCKEDPEQEKRNKEDLDKRIRHLNAYHLKVEEEWYDFIELFFKTTVPPSGIYSIKEMVRENVLTSDTDSSIYTVDELLEQYSGDNQEEGLNLNAALTYIIRMISVHQHAMFSKNMNVAQNNLYRLNMKNEYMFGSYVTTLMSKHYFATQVMVEGVMNTSIKMEIKGVHLRSSKVALAIKEFAHRLMRDILDSIYDNKKLCAPTILKEVADLERMISKDVLEDLNPVWLTTATIKDRDAYQKPESSVYQYHDIWMKSFANKYGAPPEIPYRAYKLSATTGNRNKLDEYLNSLEESGVKEGLKRVLETRKELNTFYIPVEVVEKDGKMPKEAVHAADIRTIIKQNLKSIYAVLETTGLYYLNEGITRLVSDEH